MQVHYYMPRLLPDHQIYVVAHDSDVVQNGSGEHTANVFYEPCPALHSCGSVAAVTQAIRTPPRQHVTAHMHVRRVARCGGGTRRPGRRHSAQAQVLHTCVVDWRSQRGHQTLRIFPKITRKTMHVWILTLPPSRLSTLYTVTAVQHCHHEANLCRWHHPCSCRGKPFLFVSVSLHGVQGGRGAQLCAGARGGSRTGRCSGAAVGGADGDAGARRARDAPVRRFPLPCASGGVRRRPRCGDRATSLARPPRPPAR